MPTDEHHRDELPPDHPQQLGPSQSNPPKGDTVDDQGKTGSHVRRNSAPDAGPRAEPDVQRPEVIAGYQILDVLGRGGMGVVYKAWQPSLKRHVALKMIRGGLLAGQRELVRFGAEAQAVAQLQHPNIVQIYEIGDDNGLPYISLEFVEGGSLARQLAGTPQPARPATELVRTLARAVDAAHRKGVVHRDLKPANILLTPDGTPKIADFGLAKQLGADSGQTQTGQVLGTPSYMAPEQAAGRTQEVGPASDVYALGAVLYEMLTGKPPFKGADVRDTLEQVCSQEPVPPRRLQPRIPRDLETICLKCLQKEPRRRYPSALDLAEDLGCFLEGRPILARPASRLERLGKWVRRRPALAGVYLATGVAVLALVGVAVGVVYNDRLRQANADKDRALEEKETYLYFNRIGLAERNWWFNNVGVARKLLDECPPERRGWEWHYLHRLCHAERLTLTGHAGKVFAAAVSPDGRFLASGGEDGTVRVWDADTGRELATLRPGRADPSLAVFDVAFSPRGAWLACCTGTGSVAGEVTLWDVGGLGPGRPAPAEPSRVLPVPTGTSCQAAFSPDARLVAIACGSLSGQPGRVTVFELPEGKQRFTATIPRDGAFAAAFSPDGRHLAVGGGNEVASIGRTPGVVVVWDAASGKEVASLTGHRDAVHGMAYSPDGQFLASASDDQSVKLWDARTFQERRTLRGHAGAVRCVVFHPDPAVRQLASASEDKTIKVWDRDTEEVLHTFRGHTSDIQSVAYHPDGRRLVSGAEDQTVRIWDTLAPSEARILRGHTDSVAGVAFGPEGCWLVSASHDRTVRLWDLRGSDSPRVLGRHDEGVGCVAVSPDGSAVASGGGDWAKWETHQGEIKVWNAPSGELRLRLQGHKGLVWGLAFSPDGKQLATAGGEYHHPGEVILWDLATGRPERTIPQPKGVYKAVFSPDGRRLAGVIPYAEDGKVKVWDATTGEELLRLWDRADSPPYWSVTFSPDATLLAAAGRGPISLCEAATGRHLRDLDGHTSDVLDVEFSPDGRRLVSAGYDQTLKLWDVGTGQEVLTLRGHTRLVFGVAFSPDGRVIASASFDGTVRIWEGESATHGRSDGK